ncbi:MAG TPA: SpoIIE family protein phosphatase [Nocardioidaceae bacterium]|nr:SpoIIE family protein phosphatase [Nocardioidaceae bacterium]
MNDAGAALPPGAGASSQTERRSDVESRRRELATDAAEIGIFDWDLESGRIEGDERLQRLLGYAPGELVGGRTDVLARVHPEDRPSLDRAVAEAAARPGGDFRAQARAVFPNGTTRWIAARGRVMRVGDGPMRILGAAYDVTDLRTAGDRAAHVLATMSAGYFAVDRDWCVTFVNSEAERALGKTYEELAGKNLWEAFPGAEERAFGHYYPLAMTTGEMVAFEEYYPNLSTWFEVRAVPSEEGLQVFFLDITQRHHAEEAAQTAADRLGLLASVSGELATTLDAEEAVARLARLLVPALASWCLVTVKNEDGSLRDIAWWHDAPSMRPVVEEYARERMSALTDNSFVARALRTGQPQIVSDATPAIREVLRPGRAQELLEVLAPQNAMILPLTGRGRTVGLVSLFLDADRGPLDPNDLVTAREVAVRAGLALDNARLYRQQADLAEGLQRSLLTDPPEVDGLQLVVRYQPAAQAAAVGGDWYDAFRQPDGATALVIGDVVGHDVQAAAAMGQLRGLLRGIAHRPDADPATVLTRLDAAMEGLAVNTTATAVVALVEQDAGGASRLRWSNAGHPPPMSIRADGTVTALPNPSPDLLLGFDPSTPRLALEIVAEPGTTLLLYTDGLVERRGQSIDEGLTLLHELLTELAAEGVDLETLCDELLARLLTDEPEDDVALVAVRLDR